MRRRRFLALVAASPLVAGCTGTSSPETSEDSAETSVPYWMTTRPNPENLTTVSETVLRERDRPSPPEVPRRSRPPATEPQGATEDTVSPLPYPDNPGTFTAETVADFIEAYERAYQRNGLLESVGAKLTAHKLDFAWTRTLAVAEGASLGRSQYRYTHSVKENDRVSTKESSPHLVTYYIDESVVVRAVTAGEREHRDVLVPDPWENGVILKPPNDTDPETTATPR